MLEFAITAVQAEAVAALSRLYMTTQALSISPDIGEYGYTGRIIVSSAKWKWLVDPDGRVAAEGRIGDG